MGNPINHASMASLYVYNGPTVAVANSGSLITFTVDPGVLSNNSVLEFVASGLLQSGATTATDGSFSITALDGNGASGTVFDSTALTGVPITYVAGTNNIPWVIKSEFGPQGVGGDGTVWGAGTLFTILNPVTPSTALPIPGGTGTSAVTLDASTGLTLALTCSMTGPDATTVTLWAARLNLLSCPPWQNSQLQA